VVVSVVLETYSENCGIIGARWATGHRPLRSQLKLRITTHKVPAQTVPILHTNTDIDIGLRQVKDCAEVF